MNVWTWTWLVCQMRKNKGISLTVFTVITDKLFSAYTLISPGNQVLYAGTSIEAGLCVTRIAKADWNYEHRMMLALVLMTWLIAADERDKYKVIFKNARKWWKISFDSLKNRLIAKPLPRVFSSSGNMAEAGKRVFSPSAAYSKTRRPWERGCYCRSYINYFTQIVTLSH